MSRHHSEVATTLVIEEGRDNTWWSRHQLQREEVVTRSSCREINCKDQRSRQHEAVATTGKKNTGHDNTWWSRHPLHRTEGRDIIYLSRHQIQREKRSRQDQAVVTPASLKTCRNQTRLLRQGLRLQQRSRQEHDVATVSTSWAS